MFYHIIIFKFKSEIMESQICNILNNLGKLRKYIPQIKSYSFGKNDVNNKHNNEFEYCFVMSFESKKDRDSYQQHRCHQEFIKINIDPFLENAIVFDFKEINEF